MSKKIHADGQRQSNSLDFFRGFLREPGIVGSVIPSSRFLEQRLITSAGIPHARLVIELGPGTGGTTRSFLSRLPADARLLTVEVSQEFVTLMNGIDDSRLINHCGSAVDLQAILRSYQLPAPDAVISGIPFSTMPAGVGSDIIASLWQNLAAGGRFVAYQFRGHVAELARPLIGEPEIETELRNIPPMRVFRWTKTLNGHAFAGLHD